jgi:hypothetical protein
LQRRGGPAAAGRGKVETGLHDPSGSNAPAEETKGTHMNRKEFMKKMAELTEVVEVLHPFIEEQKASLIVNLKDGQRVRLTLENVK